MTTREHQEEQVFRDLLKFCYGPEERLSHSSAEEVELIADLVSMHAFYLFQFFFDAITRSSGVQTSPGQTSWF